MFRDFHTMVKPVLRHWNKKDTRLIVEVHIRRQMSWVEAFVFFDPSRADQQYPAGRFVYLRIHLRRTGPRIQDSLVLDRLLLP